MVLTTADGYGFVVHRNAPLQIRISQDPGGYFELSSGKYLP